MSADAFFFRVPKEVIETEDFDLLRDLIDPNGETDAQFIEYDGPAYGLAGLIAYIEESAAPPCLDTHTQGISERLVGDFGWLACIPVTYERAQQFQRVLSSGVLNANLAKDRFAGACGLTSDEASEDFTYSLETLSEAFDAVDVNHTLLILFGG